MEKMKVAILGDRTSIAGFKAVGLDPYTVESPREGPEAWSSMPLADYAVVVVTEPVFQELRERIAGFPAHEGLPIVLGIPAVTGGTGMSRQGLREMMIRALGTVVET